MSEKIPIKELRDKLLINSLPRGPWQHCKHDETTPAGTETVGVQYVVDCVALMEKDYSLVVVYYPVGDMAMKFERPYDEFLERFQYHGKGTFVRNSVENLPDHGATKPAMPSVPVAQEHR